MKCKGILSTSDDEIDIVLHDCVFVQLEKLHEDELPGSGQRDSEADDPAAFAKNRDV